MPEYFTLNDVARIAHVSIHTAWRWTAKGLLPSSRPGKRRLIRRDHLEAFLAKDRRAR